MLSAPDIVLVEDDADIRAMIVRLLEGAGWQVAAAGDAAGLDTILAGANPRLVILDVNLPGEDGLSICRRIAAREALSILMLTARAEDIDRVNGLNLGADDYLGKPFHPEELTARVRALLRRYEKLSAAPRPEANPVLTRLAHISIDKSGRRAFDDQGTDLKLSSAEFDLLLLLGEARGRVLSRDHLLNALHGRDSHYLDRSVDMLVSRLRKKIDRGEPSLIEGVRNAGYVLRLPGMAA
jgi:two-component system, OmpR family, response regulator